MLKLMGNVIKEKKMLWQLGFITSLLEGSLLN